MGHHVPNSRNRWKSAPWSKGSVVHEDALPLPVNEANAQKKVAGESYLVRRQNFQARGPDKWAYGVRWARSDLVRGQS